MTGDGNDPGGPGSAIHLSRLIRVEEHLLLVTQHQVERTAFLQRSGNVLHQRQGGVDEVLWMHSELQPLIGQVDIITHNHPRGTSLTPTDLALARFLMAREVHAITPTRRFRLLRLGGAWPDPDLLDAAISEEEERLGGEMLDHLEAGRLTERQAELLYYRVLWERVTVRFPGEIRYLQEDR